MNDIVMLGLDGGGTKTVGVALDANGKILCRAETESTNYLSVGIPKAVKTLSLLCQTLREESSRPIGGLCLGSSALDERMRDEHLDAFLAACRKDPVLASIPLFEITSDAFIALYSLTRGASGALLIAGTGVMGLSRDSHGTLRTVAGWGDVLGDFGSGYDIGLSGIRCALEYADFCTKDCENLYHSCLSFYHLSDPAEIIPLVYRDNFEKSEIAAFALEVDALACKGDSRSLRLLEDAADKLARYASALCAPLSGKPFPFGIQGSVLTKNERIRTIFFEKLSQICPDAVMTELQIPAEVAAAQFLFSRSHK